MRYGKCLSSFVVLAGCLFQPGVAGAQQRAVSFASLRFGSNPAAVLETMKGLKLELRPVTADQTFPLDQRFEGELKGSRVLVSALYNPGGHLEKLLVSFLTPDEECVAVYRTLRQELRQQYGAPVVDVERWDYPYNNGGHVGLEHDALRLGRGVLASAWDREDAGTREAAVSLMTDDGVIIQLAYESSRWAVESERRKRILEAATRGVAIDEAGGRVSGTR